MVLIFLRDWRSALIVVLNIPFALLSAVILLWATGQTINIMTLGGLALAVGVLVDEATVEIENIHTQMLPGISRARAVVEACSRTAMARLLSMFCILAVFVPSFFMVGVGAPALRAALSRGGILHDRVLSAVQQPGAGLLRMADERRPSRRRAGRPLRLPARSLRRVTSASSCVSAGRSCSLYLAGAAVLLVTLLPQHRNRDLSRRQRPHSAHPPARPRRNARRRIRAPGAARSRRHRPRDRPAEHRDHQRLRRRRTLQLPGEPDPPVHQRTP